ncbi:hypothetical protein Gotur_000056 [Gossypium turneri]
MENGIAGLRIDVEEEEAWLINGGAKTQKLMHEFFLVGCFLTASVVHFTTMRNTIPNIWHPFGGVLILDLGEKRFLFKFYHELDISRGHKWASWTFNNRLLVFHWLKDSEDPMEVLLIYSYLWVQIHDLPPGKQFYARFQYEKLILFCFLCGCLGHGDSFYLIWLTDEERNIKLGWNLFMRALGRRVITTLTIWLWEDDGSELYGKKLGRRIGGGTLGGSKGLQWTQDVEDTPIEELDRKKRLRVLQNVLDVSGLGFRYATL